MHSSTKRQMLLTSGSQNEDRSSSRGNGTGPSILRRRPLRSCWKRFRCSISTSGALRTPSQLAQISHTGMKSRIGQVHSKVRGVAQSAPIQ